jgi:hypothetical protein
LVFRCTAALRMLVPLLARAFYQAGRNFATARSPITILDVSDTPATRAAASCKVRSPTRGESNG